MPYVLLRKNGKPTDLKDVVFLEHELENLKRNSPKSDIFIFVNIITRRTRKVRGLQ